MPFVLFHSRFPEIAERETRTITVLPGSDLGLPVGSYSFVEMFSNEPGCDCRRVFFYVMSSSRKSVESVVTWGWEKQSFYAKWMREEDPPREILSAIKGPSLNLGSPQTNLAPALLRFVASVLLRDVEYVERVKRHYRMFRDQVEAAGS